MCSCCAAHVSGSAKAFNLCTSVCKGVPWKSIQHRPNNCLQVGPGRGSCLQRGQSGSGAERAWLVLPDNKHQQVVKPPCWCA
jgi:hypothetical protein